ncbi:Superoxide dismutase [Halotydeus destructor]|nr:Superoxide dismutase [Halotydeus destructor]
MTAIDPFNPMIYKGICMMNGEAGVQGTIYFDQMSPQSPVVITGEIVGLSPGLHGFHVHTYGDTSNGCISTGDHFNPTKRRHGAPEDEERHVGDLGNLLANQDGVARVALEDSIVSLTGPHCILGRSLVVHLMRDDMGHGGHVDSPFNGNAGGRPACGVIALRP